MDQARLHGINVLDLSLILPVFVIFAAYIVRGISGFGSGLIAIPLLGLMLPLQLVVPLITVLDFTASAAQGTRQREKIRWREVFRLFPFSVLGVAFGLTLFHTIDGILLKQALGIFIIFYALYSLWEPLFSKVRAWWAVPAGIFAGTVGTLFGTGGPFYMMYLRARGLDKGEIRASFASIFLLDAGLRVSGYVKTEIATVEMLQWLAIGMPVMVVAMWIGGHWHHKLPAVVFSRFISALLLISGTFLVL